MPDTSLPAAASRPGSPGSVLRAFLKLGLTSCGDPVAHLGCFRNGFVERRRWLAEAVDADLGAPILFARASRHGNDWPHRAPCMA